MGYNIVEDAIAYCKVSKDLTWHTVTIAQLQRTSGWNYLKKFIQDKIIKAVLKSKQVFCI